jgi:hypothetical protein
VERGYRGRVSPLIRALISMQEREERITAPGVTGKGSHSIIPSIYMAACRHRGQSPLWSMLCMPTWVRNPTFPARLLKCSIGHVYRTLSKISSIVLQMSS